MKWTVPQPLLLFLFKLQMYERNYSFIYFILVWTIFIQGCPVQRGWLEWGPDEKKNNNNKTIIDKTLEQPSIAEVLEAQFGLKWN